MFWGCKRDLRRISKNVIADESMRKSSVKKWLKYGIGILVLLIASFLYAHVDKKQNIYDTKTDSGQYSSVQIEEGTKIVQKFVCTEKKLDGISVKLLLLNAPQKGKLTYELQDEKGKTLAKGSVAVADIKSGRMRDIKFDKAVSDSKGKTYQIVFGAAEMEEGKGAGVYLDPVGKSGGTLTIEGQKSQGTLILRTITHRFDLETFLITILFVIYIILFFKVLYRLFS